MLTVEAVCEEVIEQRDSPLVGLDWLMMLTADRIHLEVCTRCPKVPNDSAQEWRRDEPPGRCAIGRWWMCMAAPGA